MKAEYLFGLFSLIAVGSSYFVVTEATNIVQNHDHAPYTHPELRADNVTVQTKLVTVDAAIDSIKKDVEYNRERGDLIQKQNIDSHQRQEELLNKILQKLNTIQ